LHPAEVLIQFEYESGSAFALVADHNPTLLDKTNWNYIDDIDFNKENSHSDDPLVGCHHVYGMAFTINHLQFPAPQKLKHYNPVHYPSFPLISFQETQ
jgi:hypothetical protein